MYNNHSQQSKQQNNKNAIHSFVWNIESKEMDTYENKTYKNANLKTQC